MRKPIREVEVESLEDLEALPEGEWLSIRGHLPIKVVFDNLVTVDGIDYVPLPPTFFERLRNAFTGRSGARRSRRYHKHGVRPAEVRETLTGPTLVKSSR